MERKDVKEKKYKIIWITMIALVVLGGVAIFRNISKEQTKPEAEKTKKTLTVGKEEEKSKKNQMDMSEFSSKDTSSDTSSKKKEKTKKKSTEESTQKTSNRTEKSEKKSSEPAKDQKDSKKDKKNHLTKSDDTTASDSETKSDQKTEWGDIY